MNEHDQFALTVHQPLRAESGTAQLTLAGGLDDTGAPIFSDRLLSLTPSGRELALEGAYRLSLGAVLLEGMVAQRFDAGHIAGNQETAAYLRLISTF